LPPASTTVPISHPSALALVSVSLAQSSFSYTTVSSVRHVVTGGRAVAMEGYQTWTETVRAVWSVERCISNVLYNNM